MKYSPDLWDIPTFPWSPMGSFFLTLVKFYSVWTLNFLFPWNVISDQLVCLHFARLQQQQERGAWFIFVAGKSLPCLSQALEVRKTCCTGPDLNPPFPWAFTSMPSASESTGLKGCRPPAATAPRAWESWSPLRALVNRIPMEVGLHL